MCWLFTFLFLWIIFFCPCLLFSWVGLFFFSPNFQTWELNKLPYAWNTEQRWEKYRRGLRSWAVFLHSIHLEGFVCVFNLGCTMQPAGILVSWLDVKPGPQQWKHWILPARLPGNSLHIPSCKSLFITVCNNHACHNFWNKILIWHSWENGAWCFELFWIK